uniref:Ribosomal protein L32 n=2 Tax=Chamaecyparis TaxID=13414 RepID=A0A1Y1B8X5_CHAFM|nr:ribosomal protein L32 [Chamaecyparis formosensis]YP_010165198.1 ribosomal protein L32 [Chamaecyparis pisifera]QRN72071.1 ribosomal protein L32 [Chamaecyparis pisifera]BAX56525.1 ribosomal protein L32 [Chamaecyparis formosensis]BCA77425.1 ribosomal protein L32 [Chamaecyparis formosensis]BCA77508.1 ribosomal protein L32 [Chamaecyparis formosensis]BCA77591.1 ribosomal protein L32 [Chamaecyparis formosensis]
MAVPKKRTSKSKKQHRNKVWRKKANSDARKALSYVTSYSSLREFFFGEKDEVIIGPSPNIPRDLLNLPRDLLMGKKPKGFSSYLSRGRDEEDPKNNE